MHEAKIQFFTMIAHEIRTPVSLIIGPLEKVLKAQVALPESVRNDLNVIDRNSQRLLFLVNQLLDFRKVEQQGMKLKYSEQNIYQLLKSVCERFTPFITQYGATLKLECPDEGFTAMIGYEAITKVVSNLLTNASKYTKDEVTVSCSLAPDGHTFTIRVADNGIGISKEEQKKIFNPFYQAMENKPGTGIGLSIVKSIVDLHNGRIEVQSEVNEGSVFSVILPTEHAEAASRQDRPAEEPKEPAVSEEEVQPKEQASGKPVMLIVDDNREMLDFLSSSFTDKYTVLKAEDGVEAQEVIGKNDISLIVCDWMMPRMNGIELCRAVRANWATSHIPFILLTARTDTNLKVAGMDCGADAYIEKPFSVQYLMACIDNLLELRNLLRQKFSKMPLVPLNSIANNTVDNWNVLFDQSGKACPQCGGFGFTIGGRHVPRPKERIVAETLAYTAFYAGEIVMKGLGQQKAERTAINLPAFLVGQREGAHGGVKHHGAVKRDNIVVRKRRKHREPPDFAGEHLSQRRSISNLTGLDAVGALKG